MTTKDRSLKSGFPYGRGRHMGGGCLIVFEYYAELAECVDAIANLPEDYPKQFVIVLPHLHKPK